jgi:TRAP-type mannitol/chloroaromatic compound transport system permease small subunit
MPPALIRFVRAVEALNYRVGRFAMYLLFVMMAILLWSSLTKMFKVPAIWTLEMAQFTLVAYYLLGAPYSLQLGSNVRMDLLYSGWSVRKRAFWDMLTVFCLMFYLGVMLYGAVESTIYSFETGERNPTAWRPYLWPLKVTICLAFLLMLLQAIAHLIRDVATLRGVDLGPYPGRGQHTTAEVM